MQKRKQEDFSFKLTDTKTGKPVFGEKKFGEGTVINRKEYQKIFSDWINDFPTELPHFEKVKTHLLQTCFLGFQSKGENDLLGYNILFSKPGLYQFLQILTYYLLQKYKMEIITILQEKDLIQLQELQNKILNYKILNYDNERLVKWLSSQNEHITEFTKIFNNHIPKTKKPLNTIMDSFVKSFLFSMDHFSFDEIINFYEDQVYKGNKFGLPIKITNLSIMPEQNSSNFSPLNDKVLNDLQEYTEILNRLGGNKLTIADAENMKSDYLVDIDRYTEYSQKAMIQLIEEKGFPAYKVVDKIINMQINNIKIDISNPLKKDLRDSNNFWLTKMEVQRDFFNKIEKHEIEALSLKQKKVETLIDLIIDPKPAYIVENIKNKYRGIKGKRLKLLLITLQNLELLPLERIGKRFHSCCKLEFDWNIASYNAMNGYRYNKEVDNEELKNMMDLIKSLITPK